MYWTELDRIVGRLPNNDYLFLCMDADAIGQVREREGNRTTVRVCIPRGDGLLPWDRGLVPRKGAVLKCDERATGEIPGPATATSLQCYDLQVKTVLLWSTCLFYSQGRNAEYFQTVLRTVPRTRNASTHDITS